MVADQPGVKEAVLRALPLSRSAISVVIQNHWEKDAQAIILDTLAKARAGESFDEKWSTALNAISDQPGVKEAVLGALPNIRGLISVVVRNHWEADAVPVMLETLNQAKRGFYIDEAWFSILDALPDKTAYKEAVFHVLPFSMNISDTIFANHWEKEARPIVLEVLNKAKSGDNFPNTYINIAAFEPAAPGVKEAILHVLPFSQEAIDFVTQNHWEAEAKPIMLQKLPGAVFGQAMNQKWIQALASAGDPSIYPLLIAYTANKLNGFQNPGVLDDVRPLPASMVLPLVEQAWKAAQGTDREMYALAPAAKWGLTQALDRAAVILTESPKTDRRKPGRQDNLRFYAREALSTVTPCSVWALNGDLVEWYVAQKSKLGFDPGLNRFVYHPKPISPGQSWPTVSETMRRLGLRVIAGDPSAFADLQADISRAVEGLDPKKDGDKIRMLRGNYTNAVFSVIQDEAENNPAVLGFLEPVSRQPDLRRPVIGAYGRAALAGNDSALETMVHYQSHQWDLFDVVSCLGGAVTRKYAKATAFLEALSNDPNCTPQVLDRALEILAPSANSGDEAARNAYRTLEKSLDRSKG